MNELYYGNISKENLPYLDVKNEFTNYFNEFSMIPYPNFFESLEENEKIIEIQTRAENNNDWGKIKQFCFLWDADVTKALEFFLEKTNIPFDKDYIYYLVNLNEELGALIIQLKNHYQRARPYQYALYGNQKLNPYTTFSANTPSYPSGYACSIYFIGKILCFHYEEKQDEINKLISQVIESRIILGLHFKSDNDFGIEIAKTLLLKDDINKKYFTNE